MTEEALPRETGAEQAARPCPTCDTQMQVTESPYGSLIARCPKCDARKQLPLPQKAAEGSLQREKGTPDA